MVIVPGFVLLYLNPPTDGSFQKVLWQRVGFLAAWVVVAFIILRGTTVKPRNKTNDTGAIVKFNMAADLRFFGAMFLGLSTTIGWVLFVEPLWTGAEHFHWALLFFIAMLLLFWMIGFACCFNVERIALHMDTRQYIYNRGLFPVVKVFRGEFSDFANLRIQREEITDSEDGSKRYYWSLKLEWKDGKRKELELTKRPRGFEDLGKDPLIDITEVANDLGRRLALPVTKREELG